MTRREVNTTDGADEDDSDGEPQMTPNTTVYAGSEPGDSGHLEPPASGKRPRFTFRRDNTGEGSSPRKEAQYDCHIVGDERSNWYADNSDYHGLYPNSVPGTSVSTIAADLNSARAALRESTATQNQGSLKDPRDSGKKSAGPCRRDLVPARFASQHNSGSVEVTPLGPATSRSRCHPSNRGRMSSSTQRYLNQGKNEED